MTFGDNQPLPKLRAYVFVNAALSSIQKGIQATHAIQGMCVRYKEWKGDFQIAQMFWRWAGVDKTLIVCHGGFNAGVMEWWDFVMHRHHSYPRDYFREDNETLGGLTTAVSIVVPDYIFDTASDYRKGLIDDEQLGAKLSDGYNDFDLELITRLSSVQLAT